MKLIYLLPAFLFCMGAQAQSTLNSYPSASATIFIDLDGHTVANTNWNTDGPIYCAASGLDAAQISEIFNRVAEDYRPFNINITTDSAKYWSAPANRRMRVIVTPTSAWYGPVGGTAMVNTFTSADNTPCFVFSDRLGYNTKKVSEAVSHEAGHTLGLYHQSHYDASCNKVSEYHYGNGSGEIGWAPIMGAGYYQNLTLWNNGPNSMGCTSMQNDLQIITTTNGFSYRTDDHNNTFPTATSLSFTGNLFNASGVVEKNTDQDLFKFILPASGRLQLGVVPYNVGTGNAGSDLDIQVSLYNNSQTLLNVYNPGSLLNSFIDSTMNAGTYYIRIEGKGNQYAPNYASLGSYSIQGNFTGAITLPLHKLVLKGAVNNDRHQLNWEIEADETIDETELQVSDDGVRFTNLATPSTQTRSFVYAPVLQKTLQYRLRVRLANGREYFSNLITLRSIKGQSAPKLLSNFITTGEIIITSPVTGSYAIYSTNGSLLIKGQLQNGMNHVLIPALHPGVYLIRYSTPEHEWTEKFVRQ